MITSRAVAKIILVSVGVLAGLYFLFLIRQVIAGVVIAIFLAIALGPAVDFFHRRRVPRAFAILIVYVAIFLVVVGLGLLVVPPVVTEVDAFVRDVPGYVGDLRESETIREYDDEYGITEKLREQAETLPGRLADAAGALQSVTVGVFSALFQLVTILVMTFFLLLDGRRIMDFLFAQLGPERERRARAIAANVYRAVGGYVTGAFAIAAVAGVSAYLVLTILGVPFAVPLGVVMAFFVLIPLVGATIGGAIVAVVAAFDDFPTSLLVWVVFLFVYQQLENNVLQPLVYRRTVALHPLVVIIAVLIGASQLGVLGALLAIPAAATVQILVQDYWRSRGDRYLVTSPELIPPPDQREPPASPGPQPA